MNLGEADSAFIAAGVTVSSTDFNTIVGAGSNHHVLVYGTVANSSSDAVFLGNSPSVDSNNRLTVKAGGVFRSAASRSRARRHSA